MDYNFDVTLYPYSTARDAATISIDTAAGYGCWEHRDGSEGGGLWFDVDGDGVLSLRDYDGAFELPRRVAAALIAYGVQNVDADA